MNTHDDRAMRYASENATLRRAGHNPRVLYPSMRAALLARINRQDRHSSIRKG